MVEIWGRSKATIEKAKLVERAIAFLEEAKTSTNIDRIESCIDDAKSVVSQISFTKNEGADEINSRFSALNYYLLGNRNPSRYTIMEDVDRINLLFTSSK